MDAFALDWTDLFVYAFPPVQVVFKSDAKTEKRKAQNGFLIVPVWPIQPWYTEVSV